MSDPVGDLVTLLEGLDLPDGTTVLPAPQESITAPALVIRPDNPWLEPDRFCFDLERYTVVAVVSANTPTDGIAQLRSMLLTIIAGLVDPWKWIAADGPILDQSLGVPFLAARLRLEYKNGGPE